MAIKRNESVRMCRILTSGPVAALGGISGPITKCKLTDKQIVSIMRSGHKVAEYNPSNSRELKELTLDNNGESPFAAESAKLSVEIPEEKVDSAEEPNAEELSTDTVATEESPATETPVDTPVKESDVAEVSPVTEETIETEESVEVHVESPAVEIPEEKVDSAEEPNAEELNTDTVATEESPATDDGSPKKKVEINVSTSKGAGTGKKTKKPAGGSNPQK